MGLFKRKPKKAVRKDAYPSDAYDPNFTPSVVAPSVITRPQHQAQGSHLGMHGYAPRVAVSKNRKRCEGCKELVKPNVRHICLYNAHHHLDTLTDEERDTVVKQLTAARKKVGWL